MIDLFASLAITERSGTGVPSGTGITSDSKDVVVPACEGWWDCLSQDNQTIIIAVGAVCLTAIIVTVLLLWNRRR